MKRSYSAAFAFTFGLIVLAGAWLRLFHLGRLPATLNRDEAALAYNATLLSQTGQDEWHQTWPLTLRSFGDYKLVGYVWFLIPLLNVFGEHDWVVRLPSALAGIWLIYMGYRWVKDLLGVSSKSSLYVAASVALTPVLFFFSRSAFEANVALALTVTSLWCWWKKSNSFQVWWDTLGVALLLIASFTYNTPLLLLPIFILLTAWVRSLKEKSTLALLLSLVVIFVGGLVLLAPATRQKQGISIFSDATLRAQFIEHREQFTGLNQKLLGNQYLFWLQQMAQRYWQTWSPAFVITKGGAHPWHSLPGFGHLLWVQYLGALAGLVVGVMTIGKRFMTNWRQVFTSHQTKVRLALLLLTVSAFLPAVITVDAPHATRSLLWFFCLIVLSGWAVEWLQQVSWRWSIIASVVITTSLMILAMEAIRYQYVYWVRYPDHQYMLFHTGFSEALQNAPKNQPVAVIDDGGYQYILAAWYLHLTPTQFFDTLERHLPDRIGFTYGYKVANFRFIIHPNDRFASEKFLIEPESSQWRMIEY